MSTDETDPRDRTDAPDGSAEVGGTGTGEASGRGETTHPDTAPDDVEPAFAMDLDPEDQGTAEAAAESSG